MSFANPIDDDQARIPLRRRTAVRFRATRASADCRALGTAGADSEGDQPPDAHRCARRRRAHDPNTGADRHADARFEGTLRLHRSRAQANCWLRSTIYSLGFEEPSDLGRRAEFDGLWLRDTIVYHMKTTTTIRDLRNHFPKVRKLVESEGEVLLTERGKPRYRLSLYTPERAEAPPVVDFWARLTAYQPEPITEAEARALHEENRGDR